MQTTNDTFPSQLICASNVFLGDQKCGTNFGKLPTMSRHYYGIFRFEVLDLETFAPWSKVVMLLIVFNGRCCLRCMMAVQLRCKPVYALPRTDPTHIHIVVG